MPRILYLISAALIAILFVSCEKEVIIDESLPLRERIDKLVEPVTVFGAPSAIIIGVIKDGEKAFTAMAMPDWVLVLHVPIQYSKLAQIRRLLQLLC